MVFKAILCLFLMFFLVEQVCHTYSRQYKCLNPQNKVTKSEDFMNRCMCLSAERRIWIVPSEGSRSPSACFCNQRWKDDWNFADGEFVTTISQHSTHFRRFSSFLITQPGISDGNQLNIWAWWSFLPTNQWSVKKCNFVMYYPKLHVNHSFMIWKLYF
jgi:hypothetical protein